MVVEQEVSAETEVVLGASVEVGIQTGSGSIEIKVVKVAEGTGGTVETVGGVTTSDVLVWILWFTLTGNIFRG